MAKIHDLFVIELAEVIKGYGNNPDVEDPFCLSEFYRFYEMPNIAVSRDNFEKMRPVEPEQKKGRWVKISPANIYECSKCGKTVMTDDICEYYFCHGCGADMREEEQDELHCSKGQTD